MLFCYSTKARSLKGWDNTRPIENQFGVLLRKAGQDTRECQVSHTSLHHFNYTITLRLLASKQELEGFFIYTCDGVSLSQT